MSPIEQAIEALSVAIKQNEHDMLMTGEELRKCGAALTALREAVKQEPVHQFRKQHCSDWYDGFPDPEDGGGPYETRTLYPTPQAPKEDRNPEFLLGWTRYEKVRKLSPFSFTQLHDRNLKGERFDEMVDALPPVSTPVPQGPPVLLSDAEIREIADTTKTAEPGRDGYILPYSFARAIEAEVIRRGGEA